MKGVVLAGGSGTRLRPLTFSMAKQLVPVGNVPILFYGLRDLAAAGIEDVAIIISPETGGEVKKAVQDANLNVRPHFIVQDKPLGLAHALKMALPWTEGDDVLMYLGDNLIKGGVADVVGDFQHHKPNAQILLTKVDDPTQFGVAELDDAGRVVRLVEKPTRPPSDLALVGVYLFDAKIQLAVDSIKPSARGELEITDAIQYLLESGHDVRQTQVKGWWKDTGQKGDLLHANELVLRDIVPEVKGELVDTAVRGSVRVGADSRLVDCTVTGPAVIGDDVQLTRVTVGANTAIGDGVRASDAAIEDSIVMEDSEIHGWRIHNSVLGRATMLHGSAPSGFVELTLGERSEIIGE